MFFSVILLPPDAIPFSLVNLPQLLRPASGRKLFLSLSLFYPFDAAPELSFSLLPAGTTQNASCTIDQSNLAILQREN